MAQLTKQCLKAATYNSTHYFCLMQESNYCLIALYNHVLMAVYNVSI